ncbi:NAD-dependent epimerase/dehydratase family protein, partial [Fibrobacterota bacterium]
MRIFLTGGTGFIGSHLVKRLCEEGHEVHCLVRESSEISLLQKLKCKIIKGDVTNKKSIIVGMKKCDWVVHLANIYSFWEPEKKLYRDVNVNGTKNLMEGALEAGVKKVIHISTVAVYGTPIDEVFNEKSKPGNKRYSEYARTKYEGDLIAFNLCKKKGLPLIVLYPGVVLGRDDVKVSGQYIKSIIN